MTLIIIIFFNNYFLKVLDSVMMLTFVWCSPHSMGTYTGTQSHSAFLSASIENATVNSAISLILQVDSLYSPLWMTEEREDTEGRNMPAEIIALSFSAGNKKSPLSFHSSKQAASKCGSAKNLDVKKPRWHLQSSILCRFELGTDKVANDWRADQMPQRR